MVITNTRVTTHRVLELHKVSRQYGSEPAVHALVDVDFSLERGEWLAITGPSGAGKSTLLHILGCLDHPTSGRYFVDGIDTAKLTDAQRAGLRSQRIGFVFQSFHLLPYRTVLENVMLAEVYRKQSRSGRRSRALAALERVGLSHRTDFSPMKLSGGERQRVAIARALVGSPSLLLCDEPTGNLDSKSSAALLDLLEQLNQDGLTLVIVTHDENVAKRAARRIHIVDGAATEFTNGAPGNTSTGSSATAEPPPVVHSGSSSRDLLNGPQRGTRRIHIVDDAATEFTNGAPGHQSTESPATAGPPPVVRSGISSRDLLNEALAGMFVRPGRMVLTVLGIVIGLTALVATLGLTRTAGNRIISQFDRLTATEIFITARPGRTTGIVDPRAIPWDAPTRLNRLNGVVAAGTLSEVEIGSALVSASPMTDPLSQSAYKLGVYAASPELFQAVRAELRAGQFPDLGHSQRADRVAVLGPAAAQHLGITGLEQLPAIAIGDHLYLVVGLLRDVARKHELLSAVIIPEGTARHYFGLAGPGVVVVETKLGAVSLIADQAPSALRPDDPRLLKLEVPAEPKRVRDDVQTDLNVMFLMLGGLSLIVGAIGIANITLVGVMERTGEIGLRRAIGATRQHITVQFLLESASMGVIGGIIGASLGVLIVVAVSAYQVWTPVLDPAAPLLAPLVGGGIGLLSGTYPALRAARLEPVEALRL